MRDALALIDTHAPGLEVEGEMQGDARCRRRLLSGAMSGARLTGQANLLIMPNLDAANIAYNLLKVAAGNGITVGRYCWARPSRCTSSSRPPPCGASSI